MMKIHGKTPPHLCQFVNDLAVVVNLNLMAVVDYSARC